ncbi:MAG: hypothetical protein IKP33_04255 [Prevotella sp.]|nr:hypothetical protein [Prevotella sp.]
MRPLNKIQTVVYLLGAVMMVIGSGGYVLLWQVAPVIYAVGALCFVAMQWVQRYEGTSFVIRRLRRMMIMSDFLFLLAALLMFANQSNFLGLDHFSYIKYIHNNWVVVLLVAAVLQLYSSHRIGHELEKEAKKR